MQIISVPTVFSCKTPKSSWLNLAQVRQLQHSPAANDYKYQFVVVTWDNGETQTFTGGDATAILQAWQQATDRCNSQQSKKEE